MFCPNKWGYEDPWRSAEDPFPGPMAAMACLLQHRTELQELGIEVIESGSLFLQVTKKREINQKKYDV